jgi:hypothetical protein
MAFPNVKEGGTLWALKGTVNLRYVDCIKTMFD